MSENVFANEWIECLEAHYMHVIRNKDKVTEPSLSIVMHSAGFSDAQLAELRVRATMHVDDSGADFVPDLDVLEAEHEHHDHHEAPSVEEAKVFNIPIDVVPVLVEAAAPEPVDVEPVSEIADLSEAELEAEQSEPEPEQSQPEEEVGSEAELEPEPEEPDPDAPQQLSLF
jgi:hypothetical protein